jgi:hypothetical protein
LPSDSARKEHQSVGEYHRAASPPEFVVCARITSTVMGSLTAGEHTGVRILTYHSATVLFRQSRIEYLMPIRNAKTFGAHESGPVAWQSQAIDFN